MLVKILTLKEIYTNKVIWSEGIEDGDTNVQVTIPLNLFTEDEIELVKSDQTMLSSSIFNDITKYSDMVCTNEMMARHLVDEKFSKFSFEIIEREISMVKRVSVSPSTYLQQADYFKALVVYNRKTDEILFAEGTDSDGYQYHQVNIPLDKLSECSKSDLITCSCFAKEEGNTLCLGEHEAKDHLYFSGTINIDILRFKL